MQVPTQYFREHLLFVVLIVSIACAYVFYGQEAHLGLVIAFYGMYRIELVNRVRRASQYAIEDANHARIMNLIESFKAQRL